MNQIVEEKIENMIYEIRGKQVMLDSDLAKLYGCKNGTKTINQAVKRHIKRFPERFAFKLTKEEYDNILRSQFGTLELEQGHYSKYLPYVFTEQGVAMLSSVLRTSIAEEVSIRIMDAFVIMRKYISNNLIEQQYINRLVLEHDNDIKLLQESFDKLEERKLKNEIYFNGQIYDAYSKIIDILNESKENIIIIDSYADKKLLDIISNVKRKVILITRKNNLIKEIDIEKYNKQYDNLKIIYDNTFHDRYIILDENLFYHLGASINYIGNKTFSINIIEENIVKELLLDKIKGLLK
ncbi:MAG: ORF6N domain-containing protein [Lactobacillales bacterium]|nr:ORF6N domain-containing protein [Lactobacillales bacterium]